MYNTRTVHCQEYLILNERMKKTAPRSVHCIAHESEDNRDCEKNISIYVARFTAQSMDMHLHPATVVSTVIQLAGYSTLYDDSFFSLEHGYKPVPLA